MNGQATKAADICTFVAWGCWGASYAQINEVLQFITLVLTIIATSITIGVHIKKWWFSKPKV